MHGTLKLESEPGVGTTFTFSIPLAVAGHEATIGQRIKSLREFPVLIVDDNETNRVILHEIFTAWKMSPTLANSGADAIEQLAKAESESSECPFKLIVLDCMMPEMDGFELAHEIRRRYGESEVKLLMISSAARADDAARCEANHISRYLTKPVVQSELLDTILNVMELETADSGQQPGKIIPCRPLNVLVAEDGLANQHVAVGLLKAAGHTPTIACDGNEAVSRWETEKFDVILMDVHMPHCDGLEATQLIREREQQTGAHIPIIALTAAAMPEDAAACREAGMDDYLTKPIDPQTLQTMLSKFAVDELVELPTTMDVVSSSDTIPSQNVSHAGVANLEEAASRVAGGHEGLVRLAPIFEKECKELMQAIIQGIDDDDFESVHRAAHTLKGSAKLFQANLVSDLAFEIEVAASKKISEPLSRLVGELSNATKDLLLVLRTLK